MHLCIHTHEFVRLCILVCLARFLRIERDGGIFFAVWRMLGERGLALFVMLLLLQLLSFSCKLLRVFHRNAHVAAAPLPVHNSGVKILVETV